MGSQQVPFPPAGQLQPDRRNTLTDGQIGAAPAGSPSGQRRSGFSGDESRNSQCLAAAGALTKLPKARLRRLNMGTGEHIFRYGVVRRRLCRSRPQSEFSAKTPVWWIRSPIKCTGDKGYSFLSTILPV